MSPKRNFRQDLCAAIMCLITLGLPLSSLAQTSCVPPSLHSKLNEQYPGWHIVGILDLRVDDQNIWKARHAGDCPGVTRGKFDSNTKEATAVILFKKRLDGSYIQTLVVADEQDGHYKFSVLSASQDVAYLSVVSIWPPGTYSNVNDEKFKLKLDSIEYEAIEAGSLLYFYKDGAFHSELVDQ
jgi:hypothetical protein